MSTKYNEAVIAAMVEASPLNAQVCAELAERFNDEFETDAYTARGFIAKAQKLDNVEYERKAARTTKTGDPVETKREIIERLEEALDMTPGSLPGLSKADKLTLIALRDCICVNA